MQTYRVCDVAFASSIPLPELHRAECERPQFTFTLHSEHSRGWGACDWFHKWCQSDGTTASLLMGKHEQGYLLRFPDLADFLVSSDAKQVRCRPEPDTPLETIKHLFLDQVVPVIFSRQGRLVLHGSVSLTVHGAIAFVGETGWGKSTLASSFSVQGSPTLTDDCLLVNEGDRQLVAIPSYPGLRLWPETVNALLGPETSLSDVAHYSTKKRIARDVRLPFCTEPTPLQRIYFLAPPEETRETSAIAIRPVSARGAFIELVKYTYLLDVTDRLRLRQEFERLSRVAVLPLFYRLTFPRAFSRLPQVQEAILENLRGSASDGECHFL